ncbi:MAG: ABC-F family ATP-binding cassette domain-containing protein [Oscillospiraceae bacterium]|nr:ABC-F family ATP-binding cassette domain-containing protein [Oscillospiraceae bacterium]
MYTLTCDHLSYAVGVKEILTNVTFSVNQGAKVGVIGVNGAGKTTLLSLLRGALEPTEGNVFVQRGAEIGCLQQHTEGELLTATVYETALEAFSELLNMEERLNDLQKRVEQGDESAIGPFTELNERFIKEGGNEFRAKTLAILKRFGFSDQAVKESASLLSGGQKTKLLLAKLLLREPDIILLDEPTNHLDIKAIEWLEGFVRNSKKTFLIVSHDRYFLDSVTTDTMEIEHGTCRMFSGGYSAFQEKKKHEREAQLRHYEQQQKEIKRIEEFIALQRRWNRERNIIAAESRQKALARMVKIDRPQDAPKGVSFRIADSRSGSEQVLSVRELSKHYPGTKLFDSLSFELRRGNRLFVIGANGTGKSTLLKILTGRETADSGVFELGYNQSIGYYDQEQQLLDPENTVLDELWSVYADKKMAEVRGMLASFGFRGEDVFKPVSVLSGGERARLSIAKMISCGVSLLVLDEPTNHLDIASRETLEDALRQYNGTVLAVSHDRYFLRALATDILELDPSHPGGSLLFKGDYAHFLEKQAANAEAGKAALQPVDDPSAGAGKQSYEDAKRQKNRLRAAKARFEAVEKEIEKTEGMLSGIREEQQREVGTSDYALLNRLYEEADALEEKLSALYMEYETLDEELQSAAEVIDGQKRDS